MLGARVPGRPVPATLTCALDENDACNAALARALAAQGYPHEHDRLVAHDRGLLAAWAGENRPIP